MPAKRASDGCWTCKLRHKKCDEGRPTCRACDQLEIGCAYGPMPFHMQKPDRKRNMVKKINLRIKQRATFRRESGNRPCNLPHDAATHGFNVIPDMVSSDLGSMRCMEDATSSSHPPTPDSSLTVSPKHAPTPSLPRGHAQHSHLTNLEHSSSIETDFIMKYFDFVFPTLFPFYRPGLFETGRSWLLLLLGKSKIAYHSTVSLSYYFFTMALTEASTGAEFSSCKEVRWREIEEHAAQCFEGIKTDMSALKPDPDLQTGNTQKMEVLGGVIQVLIFESALGKCPPSNPHLIAAFSLFEDLMSQTPKDQSQSKIMTAVLEPGHPSWTLPGNNMHVWSPQQAGFRFCAALLIFIDVVASTALQEPPKLLHYHPDVLAGTDDAPLVLSDAKIRLSSIVGCRNWVIRCIANISALAAWKREQNDANSLSMMELVSCASPIADRLKISIAELQSRPCSVTTQSPLDQWPPFTPTTTSTYPVTSTLIWAHAAQIYLSDVVSGWQPANPDVRISITNIIKLLHNIPRHQLRALAWPICVAGCLALESEESLFLDLLAGQSKVHTAGALDDVRQILQQVWRDRETKSVGTWDLVSCFRVLGAPVLLV